MPEQPERHPVATNMPLESRSIRSRRFAAASFGGRGGGAPEITGRTRTVRSGGSKCKHSRPYHPSIYPHLPELVYFGKARERPPDGAQACLEEGTQGSSSFPDPLFSPRCATGCSSFAPVETARYIAIAGTGMSRSNRSGFLIRLRAMPKPRVLKSENIASMLRRIPWSGTLYSDGAAFMAMIHGSLWPSSWSTPMAEKTPVP